MGQESRVTVTVEGASHDGKALLETDDLVFRGDPPPGETKGGLRLKIPFKQIDALDANGGCLDVAWPEGRASFELGEKAAKWADKIRNPKSLLDKLDVKLGMRAAVIGVDDEGFLADLRARAEVSIGEVPEGANVVFLGVELPEDLPRLAELRDRIKRDGAVWVVFRKGRKDFNENDVLRLGLESGMVDVKVVRFSDTHTATKFVIRKADR